MSNVREEETKPILFNPRELKPNSCVNQVSSENRSFSLQKFIFSLDLGGQFCFKSRFVLHFCPNLVRIFADFEIRISP